MMTTFILFFWQKYHSHIDQWLWGWRAI